MPIQPPTNTLIVSDIHIGSPVSRVRECQDLINSYRKDNDQYKMKRLILLGDIFDNLNLDKLKTWEWGFLNQLRLIADPSSGVEVVWITGNHDIELDDLMFNMMGKKVYESYPWQVAGLKFFAMHGHQFDRWVRDYTLLTDIPYWIYNHIQRFDGKKHHLSRWLKEQTKELLKINDELSRGMLNYLQDHNIAVDAFFCGHTHISEKKYFKKENVWYYNSGCWTGMHAPTYITIDDAGQIKILEYKN